MDHYIYRCFSCLKEYSALDIENNFQYLCPSCGSWKEKHPLEGVLWVEYDYENIKEKLTHFPFILNNQDACFLLLTYHRFLFLFFFKFLLGDRKFYEKGCSFTFSTFQSNGPSMTIDN